MNRDELAMCPSTLLPDPFALSAEQFEEYLAACHDAGFSGVSIWSLHHYLLLGAELTAEQIKARLLAHDLGVVLIEALPEWANAPSAEQALAKSVDAIEMAALYECPNVGAVMLEDTMADLDQCVANLQAVADEAAKHDVGVAIEYLPWSGIPDIGTCWDLIQRAERDNVGFCFDSWHWHRQEGGGTGKNAEILASIPGEFIRIFQLCDAAPEPEGEPMAECMSLRPLPGDGVVDHAALFAILDEIGADPIICPEVFNTELNAQGMKPMATAVAEASRTTMDLWPAP